MTPDDSARTTFVTLLTPVAPAAIAVIELQGPDAESIIRPFWRPATDIARTVNAIRYGRWKTSIDADGPAEDVVLCWTDDDTVEIHCHGGKFAAKRIIEGLVEQGAVPRSTAERYASQSDDPYVSAAWQDIENAMSECCIAIMLDQARGGLSNAMRDIHASIRQQLLAEAERLIVDLLQRWDLGKHLTQPWRIAIVGPPNSGKSSLLNAILGFDRAIVDAVAGTTRDVLNEPISLLGWPFIIADTAGLRESDDPIEKEGVKRAMAESMKADLLLLLVEPTEGWTPRHAQALSVLPTSIIVVHSKKDLGLPVASIPQGPSVIAISAQTGEGLDAMYDVIVRTLIPRMPEPGEAFPFRHAHVQELNELLKIVRR